MVNGRGNVIAMLDKWRKLTPESRGLMGLARFREMVESLSSTWS